MWKPIYPNVDLVEPKTICTDVMQPLLSDSLLENNINKIYANIWYTQQSLLQWCIYRSCPQCNKMYVELCCAIDNNVMVQSSADYIILFWAFIQAIYFTCCILYILKAPD